VRASGREGTGLVGRPMRGWEFERHAERPFYNHQIKKEYIDAINATNMYITYIYDHLYILFEACFLKKINLLTTC
jgi:hypothetical protein